MKKITDFFLVVILAASVFSAEAGEPPLSSKAIQPEQSSEWIFFGDVRNRYESDWDSLTPTGALRNDRDRYRVRARLGVEFDPAGPWAFKVRGRTGSHQSQQSPHLTVDDFDGGPTDNFDGSMDQWFVKYGTEKDDMFLWAGRNEFPFFYASDSQEMVWDKDATLTGGFLSTRLSEHFTANAGGFALPEGMNRWNGSLAAGQIVSSHKPSENWTLKGAATFLGINGGGMSDLLLDGNGSRDYRIGMLSIQSTTTLESNPLHLGYVRVGVDGIHNFSDYSSTDPDRITARFNNATDGFVASVAVGNGKPSDRKAGSWELDYAYGSIDKLAINASYAQDDWVRWGNARQTASSDFNANQVGLRVWLLKNQNHTVDLHARAYSAESKSSVEDGDRFRLDLNYSFKF